MAVNRYCLFCLKWGMNMKKKNYILPDSIDGEMLKILRSRLKMSQREIAELFHVSKSTIERWESGHMRLQGPAVFLVKLLWEKPELIEEIEVPERNTPLRLWYMYRQMVCTVIDVDEPNSKVKIYNYTDRLQYRAVGKIEKPTFKQYEEFLEERCFPESRDKMKLLLKEMGLPFYDPFLIIEKTEGRMAEDDFWLKIER